MTESFSVFVRALRSALSFPSRIHDEAKPKPYIISHFASLQHEGEFASCVGARLSRWVHRRLARLHSCARRLQCWFLDLLCFVALAQLCLLSRAWPASRTRLALVRSAAVQPKAAISSTVCVARGSLPIPIRPCTRSARGCWGMVPWPVPQALPCSLVGCAAARRRQAAAEAGARPPAHRVLGTDRRTNPAFAPPPLPLPLRGAKPPIPDKPTQD